MRRAGFIVLYYVSWAAFAAVGLLLNLACAPLLLAPRRRARARSVRSWIRFLFDLWVRWFHASKVLHIRWRGFDRPLTAGTVYVANHPTLLDATFLLARLPDAICIFKPALMHNPAIGPAAVMAGYVSGRDPLEILVSAADEVAHGRSLLIFPEGTRTGPGSVLEPLKHGFAFVAHRGRAPVQLILIEASDGVVPRGRPWWLPPRQLPAKMTITLDERWDYDATREPRQLSAEVEQRMLAGLRKRAPS